MPLGNVFSYFTLVIVGVNSILCISWMQSWKLNFQFYHRSVHYILTIIQSFDRRKSCKSKHFHPDSFSELSSDRYFFPIISFARERMLLFQLRLFKTNLKLVFFLGNKPKIPILYNILEFVISKFYLDNFILHCRNP